MAIAFSDLVRAQGASAMETVRNGVRTYFIKLDGEDRFVRVSKENFEYAKSLMKRWHSLYSETKGGMTRHHMCLSR